MLRAEAVLRRRCGERLRVSFPLATLTTFRIGGPASLYLEPEHVEDLEAASEAIIESDIPFAILGKGSNVLVSDEGFPGLVLRLGRGYRWAARDGDRLTAGGAMTLPALAGIALRHGLAGLEFGVAIPASLGGAVRMNAGAHGGHMADVVERAEVFELRRGVGSFRPAADIGFAYRSTGLDDDAVVIAATACLRPAGEVAIRAAMNAARSWRRRTQPLAEPNCGSVFTNPPGDHAARLIESVGGKGLRIGGAEVSVKHANFIVASSGARASDVAALIDRLRELVRKQAGVELETEVRMIGRVDDGAPV